MIPDPIVEEIRHLRDEIARAHDYDIDAIFDALRLAETTSGRKHVVLSPRPSGDRAELPPAPPA